jgi:hypothetical protein
MKSTRRQFMMTSAAGLASLGLVSTAQAQAMVAETDAQAIALGYKEDTTKVDPAKFPKHKADQLCSNCALYTAKTADAGACSIFPGKLVAGPGWCNLWVKKA